MIRASHTFGRSDDKKYSLSLLLLYTLLMVPSWSRVPFNFSESLTYALWKRVETEILPKCDGLVPAIINVRKECLKGGVDVFTHLLRNMHSFHLRQCIQGSLFSHGLFYSSISDMSCEQRWWLTEEICERITQIVARMYPCGSWNGHRRCLGSKVIQMAIFES
jgi:hypothetical protein